MHNGQDVTSDDSPSRHSYIRAARRILNRTTLSLSLSPATMNDMPMTPEQIQNIINGPGDVEWRKAA